MYPKTMPKPTTRKAAIPRPAKPRVRKIEPEPEVMLIQGRRPDSKEEYYVAMALERLGWRRYYYQFIVGLLGTKGYQKLDFVVPTPGRWTVIDVRGAYWHTGRREDELSLERAVKSRNWRLVVIWDYDATSIDAAASFLRTKIGER